jgi:hypothetical protein
VQSFYLFGIGGLIAWNAILSDMDFFSENVIKNNKLSNKFSKKSKF